MAANIGHREPERIRVAAYVAYLLPVLARYRRSGQARHHEASAASPPAAPVHAG